MQHKGKMCKFAGKLARGIMINRKLIRLKAVQIAYAYHVNGGNKPEKATNELLFSLEKAYELYHYLLLLPVAIWEIGREEYEVEERRFRRMGGGTLPNRKFADNLFVRQLMENKELGAFVKSHGRVWDDEEEFVRGVYKDITGKRYYVSYMDACESDYAADRELWRKIYKTVVYENEALEELLEDKCVYWCDDKFIVDTFVLKTIKRFRQENGAAQPLLPEYESAEDKRFATDLLHTALTRKAYYQKLISENTKNWEFERICVMDLVIMELALAEITTFADIPVSVSLNEYVEVAKEYSTPQSGRYVNGMLNAIVEKLQEENLITKNN